METHNGRICESCNRPLPEEEFEHPYGITFESISKSDGTVDRVSFLNEEIDGDIFADIFGVDEVRVEKEVKPKTKDKAGLKNPPCCETWNSIVWLHRKRTSKLLRVLLPFNFNLGSLEVLSTGTRSNALLMDEKMTASLKKALVEAKRVDLLEENRCYFDVSSSCWPKKSDSKKSTWHIFQLKYFSGSSQVFSSLFHVYEGSLTQDIRDKGWAALAKLPQLPIEARRYLSGIQQVTAWKTISSGEVVDTSFGWESDLASILAVSKGLGDYANKYNWWTGSGKDGASAHLRRGLVGTELLCALPYFHIKHRRFFWLCLTFSGDIKSRLSAAAANLGKSHNVKNSDLVKGNEFEVNCETMLRYVQANNPTRLLALDAKEPFATTKTPHVSPAVVEPSTRSEFAKEAAPKKRKTSEKGGNNNNNEDEGRERHLF